MRYWLRIIDRRMRIMIETTTKNKSNNNGEWRMGDGWFEEAWEDQALLVRTIAR